MNWLLLLNLGKSEIGIDLALGDPWGPCPRAPILLCTYRGIYTHYDLAVPLLDLEKKTLHCSGNVTSIGKHASHEF